MNERKSFQNGITLIALVISIIVMLILAGVSLNATIGDNGIITQAQNATYMQSIAALEEYFNNYYIEHYDEMNKNDESKVLILTTMQPNWFYIPANEGVGGLRYIVDSEGHALYLIKKSGLPDEIKKQIKGGEAGKGNYADYASLNDVYGLTADLKVYYCSNGSDSIIGMTKNELNDENLLRVVLSSDENKELYELLKDYDIADRDGNKDGNLTVQELKAVKSLTINDTNKISDFKDFYNLTSLQELTIENQKLNNLEGIQNCPYLSSIFLKGCIIDKYEAIGKLENKLKEFWIYNIDDSELEKICSKEYGIGAYDLKNLNSFAIVGNTNYVCSKDKNVSSSKSERTITSIKPISNLTDMTKNAITKMSLQNNNLQSIEELTDFRNITLLRVEYNNLYDLKGLENLNNLQYLCATNNILGINENDIQDEERDVLSILKNKNELEFLNLSNNVELKWVEYLENLKKINNLYLSNNIKMNGASLSKLMQVIKQCGSNYSIPPEYSLLLLGDATVIDLSNQTITKDNFLLLKNKSQITHLNLKNINLIYNSTENAMLNETDVNSIVNEVLSTLVNMQCLQLDTSNSKYSLSKLYNISFVKNMNDLVELGLMGTNISGTRKEKNEEIGLKLLNEYCEKLEILAINQDDINLVDIEKAISKCMKSTTTAPYWRNTIDRTLVCSNSKTLKTLENCVNLTVINLTGGDNYDITLDFSNLKNLKSYGTGWENTPNVILPESVTYISLGSFLRKCDMSKCKYLSFFYHSGYVSNANLVATLSSINEDCVIDNFQIRNEVLNNYADLQVLHSVKSKNIKQLTVSPADSTTNNTSIKSLDGIENFTNLEVFSIERYGELKDISKLKNLKELKSIVINKSKVSDISCLRELENLEYLRIINSSVTSLKDLENLEKLNYLNLEDNCIYDTSSFINSNGEIENYRNLDIIKKLNGYSLKKVYLKGNGGITDYNIISNLKWDAKSGF